MLRFVADGAVDPAVDLGLFPLLDRIPSRDESPVLSNGCGRVAGELVTVIQNAFVRFQAAEFLPTSKWSRKKIDKYGDGKLSKGHDVQGDVTLTEQLVVKGIG